MSEGEVSRGMSYTHNNVGPNSKVSEETVSESTENCRFRQPHYRLTPPVQGTPQISP